MNNFDENREYDANLNELLRRSAQQKAEESEEYEDSYDEDYSSSSIENEDDDSELSQNSSDISEEESENDFIEEEQSKSTAQSIGLSKKEAQEMVEAWETFLQHYTHERLFFCAFCILLILGLSSWNTFYEEEIHNVNTTEKKLDDLRNRSLITTAELVSLERINNIEQNIQSYGLNLEHSSHPPYKLIDKNTH
ncbi:MAG: FtsL-like putative cell division protein [Porphyromonas sp.]|jgi:hypothetical protein